MSQRKPPPRVEELATGPDGLLCAMFAQTSNAVLLVDRVGNVLFSNQAAAQFVTQAPERQTEAAPSPLCNCISPIGEFREPVLRQILQTKNWNCIELHSPPERMGHDARIALVVELSPSTPSGELKSVDTSGALLIVIPSLASQQSSLADREEFLATAAHDLKNPLSAIFGYADAIVTSMSAADLSDKARSIVAKIRAIASRSVDLVRNYQQLAELAQLKPVSAKSRTDLNALLKTVVEETFRETESAHTVVVVPASPPVFLCVEKLPLERIVANLFGNALRYTPHGGTITLSVTVPGNETGSTEARNAPSSHKPDTSGVSIHVHNTGSVIPADEIPLLMSRRYRGSTSVGTSGTGLGLFIVQGIVQRIGGTLEVESSRERGTTFSVHLPAQCVANTPPAAPTGSEKKTS